MKSFTVFSIRLSEHNLAVERGHHRQTWLPREERLCTHCTQWRWKRTTVLNHLSTVSNTWETNIHRLKPPNKLKTKQLPYHSSKSWELLWLENRIQLEYSHHEDCQLPVYSCTDYFHCADLRLLEVHNINRTNMGKLYYRLSASNKVDNTDPNCFHCLNWHSIYMCCYSGWHWSNNPNADCPNLLREPRKTARLSTPSAIAPLISGSLASSVARWQWKCVCVCAVWAEVLAD